MMDLRPFGLGCLWAGEARCAGRLMICTAMLGTAAGALPRQMDAQGRPRAMESHPGVDTALGELLLDTGHRVRTIVSNPRASVGDQPCSWCPDSAARAWEHQPTRPTECRG